MINSTQNIAERLKNEKADDYTVYLCKTCGHNVCYPVVLHSKGKITDGEHDMVYIGSEDKAGFEAYYYTHQILFA
jgi:hypothetical protein